MELTFSITFIASQKEQVQRLARTPNGDFRKVQILLQKHGIRRSTKVFRLPEAPNRVFRTRKHRFMGQKMERNPKKYQFFSKFGGSAKQSFQNSESEASICEINTKEYRSFWQTDCWERQTLDLSELGSINSQDRVMAWREGGAKLFSKFRSNHGYLRDDQIMEYEERKKRIDLMSIYHDHMDSENMESEGVPINKVLASYIFRANVKEIESFLNKLEEKGPKGTALATLRRSEKLLFSDDYRYLVRPKQYNNLMIMYRRRGEKQDLRRLWNLAKNDMKLLDVKGYSYTLLEFLKKEDIEGAHEVLEGWDNGIFRVKIRDFLVFRYLRKIVTEEAELTVDDMLEDHNEEKEKKNRAMEVRQNGWDPKKNLALSAYTCVQYVEGRRDIESAVDILRLLGTQEPHQDGNNNRLSRKMVEAMIGGGYFGEQE